MKQMSLFQKEERAAIIEYEAGKCRRYAENKTSIKYIYRGPLPYLLDLVKDKEPLIHLFGRKPHICLVRSLTSYEPDEVKKTAWCSRKDATRILRKNGYRYSRKLTILGYVAEVWHLEERPDESTIND